MVVRLETLGGIRVLVDEVELGTLPSQRLRCALLVYLGVNGQTTRDTLLGVFWPDRDRERARHALSQTLYELRRDLGDTWVEVAGEMLKPGEQLQVDATAFEDAIEGGHNREAVELYAGPFLDGVYLWETTEFEGWVDRQRSRLARRHRVARGELISAQRDDGALDEALLTARGWVETDPLDDEAQHQLIELMALSGQRSQALQQFERYQEELERELEVVPLDETLELVERIRSGEVSAERYDEQPREPAPDTIRPGVPTPTVETALPAEAPAGKDQFVRRFGLHAVVVVAILVVIVLMTRSATPLDAHKVAIFPLADRGGNGIDGASVAMVIGNALVHTHPLKWIDGWEWLSPEFRDDVSRMTQKEARRIARDRGASHYITGGVLGRPDSVSVTLALYATAGDSLVRQATASGALADLTTDQVALHAVIELLPALLDPDREVDLSFLLDRDPSAITFWIQGDKEYRQAHFSSALALYRRAVDQDSLLAMAAFRGALAADWLENTELTGELVGMARRAEGLLPPKHQHLLRGLEARLAGDADEAVRRVNSALEYDREWSAAWTSLGEIYHHFLPSDWDDPAVARTAFETATRYAPDFTPALVHLAQYALWDGDLEAADRMLATLAAVDPEPLTIVQSLELMRTCLAEGPEAVPWDDRIEVNPGIVLEAGLTLSAGNTYPRCSEAAFRSLLDHRDAPTDITGWALMGVQGVLISAGRDEEALELVAEAVADGASTGLFLYLLDAIAGADAVEQALEVEAFAKGTWGDDYATLRGPTTLWALSAWHAYRGDAAEVGALLARIQALQVDGDLRMVPLIPIVRAHLAVAAGEHEQALRSLSALKPRAPRAGLAYGLWDSLAVERLMLARLLLERERYEDAYRVAAAFDHSQPMIFRTFVGSSLELRLQAASALNSATWSREAERLRERLRRLRSPRSSS